MKNEMRVSSDLVYLVWFGVAPGAVIGCMTVHLGGGLWDRTMKGGLIRMCYLSGCTASSELRS